MDKLDLSKGQKLDLSKIGVVSDDGSLKDVYFGAGWDVAAGADDVDLDIIAIAIVGGQPAHVGYFGNKNPCPGIALSDDNTTGEGEGDDEFVNVTAADLPADVEKIILAINIYEAEEKGQNFGMVDNAYMRIVNPETDEEGANFDLQFDASTDTGLVFGELLNRKGKWFFSAEGVPFTGTVNDLVALYTK